MRQLQDANNNRRKSEVCRRSLPDGGIDQATRRRIDNLVEEYGQNLTAADSSCKSMEKKLGATAFRFPKAMRDALAEVLDKLLELGRMVNEGQCNAADIQSGQVMGAYHTVCRMAEGWQKYLRLPRVLLGVLTKKAEKAMERIRQDSIPPKSECVIGLERIDAIGNVLQKVLGPERCHPFAVHPPQAVVDDSSKLGENLDVMALKDTQFKIVFHDGSRYALTFHELLFFVHQLVFLTVHMNDTAEKLDRGGFGPVEVHFRTAVAPNELMRPEVAKVLISKIEFSPIPAEGI